MSLHLSAEHSAPETLKLRDRRVIRVRRESADWSVRASWRDLLFGPNAPDWFALEGAPDARCVKSGLGRSVWRVRLGDRVLFAKVFDKTARLGAIRRWLTGNAAKTEFRKALAAEQRGVPVVQMVGVGRQTASPSRAVLLSEELSDALSLPEAWNRKIDKPKGGERRRAVARWMEPVAKLYALAHARGFVHLDGHPHNVLTCTGCSGELEAVFVDLHSARLTRAPAPRYRVVRSLGQLDHFFRRLATRSERVRFLRRYLSLRTDLGERGAVARDRRSLIRGISQAVQGQAIRLAWQRDRRLRGDHKYFATLSFGDGWRAGVVLTLERRHLFPEVGLRDRTEAQWRAVFERWLQCRNETPTAGHRHETPDLGWLERRPTGFRERLSWTLLGSPCRKAFIRCHQLRHRDIHAGLILGYLEHRTMGLVDAALLIQPREEGDTSCHPEAAGVNGIGA